MTEDSGETGDRGGCHRVLTYREVGATRSTALPGGYRQLHRAQQIGVGQEWFDEAVRRLLTWEMHRRAGLEVRTSTPVAIDQTALLRIGLGPLMINAPVRVMYLVDEPRERGFAYGTLVGHPEIGEERFTVRIKDDGVVVAEIRAFSRPGRWFTRLGRPVARRVQEMVTQRYLDAFSSRTVTDG